MDRDRGCGANAEFCTAAAIRPLVGGRHWEKVATMIATALATTIFDPDDDQKVDIFEPHVSEMGGTRALHFFRHACATTRYCGVAANRAPFAARHARECSLRLVEAVATGAARSLAARSPGHLVEAQGEFVHAYLYWLSFSLRGFVPAILAAPETG